MFKDKDIMQLLQDVACAKVTVNEAYNKLFLMAVYILQAQNVQDFKDEMNQMREKASKKTQ